MGWVPLASPTTQLSSGDSNLKVSRARSEAQEGFLKLASLCPSTAQLTEGRQGEAGKGTAACPVLSSLCPTHPGAVFFPNYICEDTA